MAHKLPKTLLACLNAWEVARPNAVYLTQPYPDGSVVDYSWAKVGDEARRIAAYLRPLHLPPQSRIGLLGRNSAHWIIADLAIMMSGHVSVPLYPTMGADTARFVLEHSEARLLFIGKLDGTADNWPAIEKVLPPGLPMIGLPMAPRADLPQWNDLLAQYPPLDMIHEASPDELCTIIYTSGSTGVPKGVMHSHGSLLAAGAGFIEMLAATTSDRLVSYLPLAHIAERAGMEVGSLLSGFHVYFCNNLSTFLADVQRARPTVFQSVPRLWVKFQLGVNAKLSPSKQHLLFALPLVSRLVKRKILRELGLGHARLTLTGTAPLPPTVLEWYRRLGLEMLEAYGMTETGVTHLAHPGQYRPGYVGTCCPGVEARIDDSGELLIRGPGLMQGYYRLPEATVHDMTADGFFHTGDRGEIDDEGRLRLTGRIKELFKTARGKYVAPAPIENKLGACPYLEGVCVTGPGLAQPFALLMLSDETRQSLARDPGLRKILTAEFDRLVENVNKTLESHEVLSCVVVVAEPWTVEGGLLTPTLKIKREAIESRYLPQAEAWVSSGRSVEWE